MSAIVRETSEYVEMSDSITLCIVKDGAAGSDAVTYGVQVTPYLDPLSSGKTDPGIQIQFTRTTGATVETFTNVTKLGGLVMVYVDGVYHADATRWINIGNDKIVFSHFPIDNTSTDKTLGTASTIGIELLVDSSVVATANYANGKQGDGVVMAYKHADTQPDAPTGTDPEYPGDGWSLSPDAATAREKVTDVKYGGYESGTYDGTNKGTDATAKEWTEAEDDGRTWMKSPSGLGDNFGYALMKVSFTTQYDNTTVDVEIKAYSEQNYDLVEVWALDTAPDTGTTFRGQGLAHASGNGVEQAYSFTVAKAGRHFICVTYAKDISGNDNGDYGLFRLDLSDNEVAVSDTVWMSQAKVSGGKCVLPWSTPVKINGADGIGAFEILCDPETIVIDTKDNGLATELDNAYASLMCLRDGKEVSGVTYKKGLCMNCGATVNTDTGVVTITSVRKQSVTVDGQTVEVSCTSGSVTVMATDPTTKTTYVKTIPFSVDVAKFNGGLKADNKTLKSQYKELTNDGSITDLKEYRSEILQSAREISLHVSEKRAGRRNLLPGSAFRKQGEGCSIVQDGQDAINGICINGGYDGVNCARLRNEGNARAAFPRISWDGGRNSNVKVAKGKKYTLSFWAKRLSATEGGYEISTQFFLQNGANGSDRPYHALKMGSFTVKSQGEWEFIQDTVTIPSEAKANYVEVCICLALTESGMAEILVCRPMLEEGEEYNGWTLSEQDYDYVGGNLLDGTATLAKMGNVEVLDPGNVTQGGMGESASIKAELLPTVKEVDFLQYSTSGMGIKANEDYTLSFYAKTEGNAGKLQCYLYRSEGTINTEDSDGGYDNTWNPKDGDLRYGIVVGTTWKRYWVHWRPTKADPEHVLFRLMRGGNDRGTYSSYTTYAVDDVVLYDGTYYRCIMAGQGNTPSSSSSYWDATKYGISLSQPKLEVGATMTEWTAKRSDMVDKQALLATGIDIENKKIVATADNFVVRNNSGTPTFSIDEEGNIVGSGGASFNGPMKATTFTLNSTYFSVKEDGTITAKGGQVSFFRFDAEGMASAVEYDSSQNKPWRGMGLSSNNISVSGYTGQRISSVFLGKGLIDSRFAGSDKNYIVHRVGSTSSASTFYNYIKLERFEDGHDSYENDPEYAALGIETQGDFCLAALGGPSLFAGMCFASNTGGSFTADKRHCFYLCSGGTFYMPSDPPDGMLIVVIQTGSRINFNGNRHGFRCGTNYSESCNSNSAGQWNLFYYDGSNWNTVYINGRPW